MMVNRKKVVMLLVAVFMILLTLKCALSVKEVTVENKDLKIISKEVFYCQPIYRYTISGGTECIIKASYTIIAKNKIDNVVKDISFVDKEGKDIDKTLTKDVKDMKYTREIKSIDKLKESTVEFSFWTSVSGKYDITVNGLVLDPYYNITINSTYPSYYLKNLSTSSDADTIAIKQTLTKELSDNLDSTKYMINKKFYPTTHYRFENNTGTTITDSSGYSNTGTRYHALYVPSKNGNNTRQYALFFNSTAKVNITSSQYNGFDYPEHFSFGCWVNATKSSATVRGIINKGWVTASNSNYNLNLNGATNTTNLGLGNGTTNLQISTSAKTFIQGKWLHVFATVNTTNKCIFIDGVKKTCSTQIINYKDNGRALDIGKRASSEPFLGKIDECAIFNRSLSFIEVKSLYDAGIDGNAVKAYFNHSLNKNNSYWLKIKKLTSGLTNVTVYKYVNNTHINITKNSNEIMSTGYDFISINNIVTEGYNKGFRIRTDTPNDIAEVFLIEQVEDNNSPEISDCKLNTTKISCNQSIKLSCNVTDEYLNKVYFGWNDTTFNYQEVDSVLNTNTFYKILSYLHNTSITGENYTFVFANATDIVDKKNKTVLNLRWNYKCAGCNENWNLSCEYGECGINDSKYCTKIYTDLKVCNTTINLPPDNGTINVSGCNYCSEDIREFETLCEEDQKITYYIDYNYSQCCGITSLMSDCNIIYGNYSNRTEACDQGIYCFYNSNPFLKTAIPFSKRDFIDFYCIVNSSLTNYSCISEIYKDGSLLQTNPNYQTVDMYGAVSSFDGSTPIIRGWYRKGTLLPENSFQVKMRCSKGHHSPIDIVIDEFSVTPTYKSLSFSADKMIWLKRNWGYIFAIAFVVIFVITLIHLLRK